MGSAETDGVTIAAQPTLPPEPWDHAGGLASFLGRVLGQATHISDALRELGDLVAADAVFLWKEKQQLSSTEPRELLLRAAWERDGRRRGHPVRVEATSGPQRASIPGSGAVRERDTATLHAPVSFGDRNGVLTVRWPRALPSDETLALVEAAAQLVPAMAHILHERASFRLVRAVELRLSEARGTAAARTPSWEERARAAQTICEDIAASLHCLEASLFLSQSMAGPFGLVGTTWTGGMRHRSYERGTADGITGWVIKHRRPVRIYDKVTMDRDRAYLEQTYPGIRWEDSLNLREEQSAVRRMLDLAPEAESAPLGCIVVPVMAGQELVGVLRCCAPRLLAPYFSSEEEERLLAVADLLGRVWCSWLETERHGVEWVRLLDGFNELGRHLETDQLPDERGATSVFDDALDVLHDVVTGADKLGIWLCRDDLQRFELVSARSQDRQVGWMLSRHSDTRRETFGAFMSVVSTGEVLRVNDYTKVSFRPLSDDVRSSMIVPIVGGRVRYGVLEVSTVGSRPFTTTSQTVVSVVARQLSLYLWLSDMSAERVRKQAELAQHVQRQAEFFRDVWHQLRNPSIKLERRVTRLLAAQGGTLPSRDLMKIRGLVRKIDSVTKSIGTLAELDRKGAVSTPCHDRLDEDQLVHLLVAIAEDTEILDENPPKVRFHVDRTKLRGVDLSAFAVDLDLLTQAISNVADNARKYSYPSSTVEMVAELSNNGNLAIVVRNKGIPIEPHEVPYCTIRGWRSESASEADVEGTGIGLWLVKKIIEAHGGHLHIGHDRSTHTTEVKLVFPRSPDA